jgi:dihydropteroate synthase
LFRRSSADRAFSRREVMAQRGERGADVVAGAPTPPLAFATRWRLRERWLDLTEPQIMAICNVTPDSFSDGGLHNSVELALRFAEQALRNGASIVDIGGESTRPGALPVASECELDRVIPVVAALRTELPELVITVDTVKAEVARAALDAGAHGVNDVSGGRLDPLMMSVVAAAGAGVVLMHSRGTSVRDLACDTLAGDRDDVTAEVVSGLLARVAAARLAGVTDDAMVLDPGIGFSKTTAQSVALLRELHQLVATGFPVLVGASRKRVIGELTGVPEPTRRVVGSAVAHAIAVARGARIVRVHDVAATRDALRVMTALSGV